jgi:hypothetical protein
MKNFTSAIVVGLIAGGLSVSAFAIEAVKPVIASTAKVAAQTASTSKKVAQNHLVSKKHLANKKHEATKS